MLFRPLVNCPVRASVLSALGLLVSHTPALREVSVCALLMTLLGLAPSYLVQHLVDSVLVRNEVRLL
jgi:ABC-type bacteriocin/lantibiotic exporter with double-glycine peptidase domain